MTKIVSMSVIQHALAVVKMDAIAVVIVGVKTSVISYAEAIVRTPVSKDVQMHVLPVQVVVSITVLPVTKVVRVDV